MFAAALVLAMQLQAVVPADARVMPVWALPPAQDTQPRKRLRLRLVRRHSILDR